MTRSSADAPSFMSGGGTMGELIRAHDWSATPLGPPGAWPEVLRSSLRICLSSAFPTAIYWGPDLVLLYNDSWSEIPAERHPGCLGRPCREVWADIWSIIEPQFAAVMETGEGFSAFDQPLPMERDGDPIETYWDYSFTPLVDGQGRVRGVLNQGRERTAQVLGDRRQQFRIDLEDALRGLAEPEAIVAEASRALGRHLGVERVGFGELQPDDRTVLLNTPHAEGLPALDGFADLDGFGAAAIRRLRAGATLASPDIAVDETYDRAAWETISTRAFVCVPMVRFGRLRATMYVNAAAPRRWTREEIALVEGVAARVWDAVERARAERALRDSEAHLTGVFQQTGAGFAEVDTDGGFLSVNSRFCDMAGRKPEELLRLRMRDITHPDERALSEAALGQAAAAGEPATVEKRLLRPDGTTLWVANTKSAIAPVAGRRTVLVVAIDIAERKAAERALVEAKAAADEANLAKSTFIANMSHELRTPLSAIIGYSEMMAEEIADGCDGADLAADMAKVESNARHLLGLINDVLDLSKIESGKMEVYAERFEVEPVLREIGSAVHSLVDKKHNRLELQIAPALGTAETDLTKLRQMLLNLLSNAAKFTEDGTITLSAGRDGERLVFEVRDTGVGMTPEQLAKLFQRFTQADSSTTRKFGGTGLGLSLTRAFADMLGGTIEVASEAGRGTTFRLAMPAAYMPPAAAPEAGGDADDGRDLVLVIDDDADQRALMGRFLAREGFRSRAAADGATGLAMARALRPRAILLDVMMPGLDGWSVLSALKADPDLAEVPVVMVTFVDQRGLAQALGAADYVLKPVRWERFKAVMDRYRAVDAGRHAGVLVVDDDEDQRARVRAMLERDGWAVTEAADGRAALDLFASAEHAVVLLDLTMPVMDGFACLAALRARPDGADVPVVVLTALDLTREDRRRLAGANQILNKGSVTLQALVERLQTLVGGEPAPVTG